MHYDQRGLLIEVGDTVAGHYYGGYARAVLFTVLGFTKKQVKLRRVDNRPVGRYTGHFTDVKYAPGPNLAIIEKGWRTGSERPGDGEPCFVRFTCGHAPTPSVAPAEYNDGEFCILSPADWEGWQEATFAANGMHVDAWKPMIFPEP